LHEGEGGRKKDLRKRFGQNLRLKCEGAIRT